METVTASSGSSTTVTVDLHKKRQRTKIVYVPAITAKQLKAVRRYAEALEGLADVPYETAAFLSWVVGDNTPEGWKSVHVRRESVRQKSKKAL